MKQTEIMALIGLSSTDPKLVAFFERHGLKAPKTVNANASGKVITHKNYKIDFVFDFDIIHEAYYPPVSPKKNDYDFIAYLKNVYFYLPSKNDTRPNDFWDVTPNPLTSFEDFENYFGKISRGNFKKPYNNLVNTGAEYDVKKNKCIHISAGIRKEREIINHYFFDPTNEHNLWPEAYTFLIKWLFDNRFLNIDDDLYKLELEASHQAILEFVKSHLKNRLWKNQLKDIPDLFEFLITISSNNSVKKDENKQQVIFYQNHLFLIATGHFDAYKKLYYEDIFKADALCKAISFNPETADSYLKLLSDKFEIFPKIKALKINN